MTAPAFTFRPRPSTSRLVLHDSHTLGRTGDVTPWLRTNGRIKGLLEVGYHAVIEQSGHLEVTRPFGVMGSHAPGHNHDTIGICLATGRDGGHKPTREQMATLGWLWADVVRLYPGIKLVGHSEFQRYKGRPACPCFDMGYIREGLGTC